MSARFIVLEGADGTGTTTQARALEAWLTARGETVLVTCEPSAGPIGKEIRARLKAGVDDDDGWRALALLFAADRLDHLAREIRPALARGEVVISDRYVLSSLVYQSLHVDEAWVATLNQHATAPDLTLVLTLPLDVALARVAARQGTREAYDDEGLQARIHAAYARHGAAVGAVLVDGQGRVDEVTARLAAVIAEQDAS